MKKIGTCILLLAVLTLFLFGISELGQRQQSEDLLHLEEAFRRAAVACYASEGFYPPDAEYLCRNYGVSYDQTRYAVHYEVFASNLMPDITVTERTP